MNGYLRQATASQVRTIGPFVDDTDFKTLENGLTINNTDIVISINGGADTTKTSGGATAHGAGGIYTLTWDATDSASVGELSYSVKVAGALVVFGTYVVLEEAVYDALFAASAPGYVANAPVNVAQWLGSAAATPTVAGVPEVDVTHWIGTAAATPTVAGVPEVDLTHWLGTAAATPTVAGVPEVDVTHIGGDAQSATDLKDFADAGYDPATNKVQGVVLTDTLTTYTGNTVQTGDSYAIVNSGTHGNAALKTLIDAVADSVWAYATRALTAGGVISGAIAAAELNAIADAILDRNMATGTDSGTDSTSVRTTRQALRRLRNKESISAGTLTVTKEDDTTASWTAAVTTSAGDPLSAVDPT